MSFNPNAQLDPSQVDDQRGRGIGGRGVAIGGGGLGLIIVLVYALLTGSAPSPSEAGALDQLINQTIGENGPAPSSALATECKTGADANQKEDCRIVGYINSVQAYWKQAFSRSGQTYEPAKTRFFSGALDTGCGTATTEVGPFYCPNDGYVYIDLGFFNELRTRFGAQGGSLAEGYVIAHEYGHHVQDLLGVLRSGTGSQGATGSQVRIELQADCYAGAWAAHAVETKYLQPLTDAQIADALDAASAVGDDRIQAETQGQVNPETWTHGSSDQRRHWFSTGYSGGNPADCDTSGPI
jgi:predicted metalloprotease